MSKPLPRSTYRPPSPTQLGRDRPPPRRSGVAPRPAAAPPVTVPRAPRAPSVPPRASVPLASIPLAKPQRRPAPATRPGGVAEVIELRRRTRERTAPPAEPAVVVRGCIWLLGPSPDEEQDAPVPLVRIS